MIGKVCAVVLAVFLVGVGLGMAAEKPAPVKFAGGEYTIAGDQMIVLLDWPATKNRDTLVGHYATDPKTGASRLNMDQEADMTDRAKDARARLLALATETGLSLLRSAIVQHDRMILTKFQRPEWAPFEAKIKAIFEEGGAKKK